MTAFTPGTRVTDGDRRGTVLKIQLSYQGEPHSVLVDWDADALNGRHTMSSLAAALHEETAR